MKVYLLPLDHGPTFFGVADDEEESRSGPARGWLARTAHSIRSSLKQPKGGLARKVKAVWEWLQQRLHPDEYLLAALRTARSVEIFHPPAVSAATVETLWRDYLGRRRWRYALWLTFNTVLSPVAVLLTPLPGPNVIGYWFAYRAVRDLLIVIGATRALGRRVPTTFHAETELQDIDEVSDDVLDRLKERLGLEGVHEFVARLKERAEPPVTGVTAQPTVQAGETGEGSGGIRTTGSEIQGPCDC